MITTAPSWILALTALACSGNTAASADASDASDAAAKKWPYVTIARTATAGSCPANVGAEIDTVALYRIINLKGSKTDATNWKLVGVAQPGSAVWLPGTATACQAANSATNTAAAAGPVNASADAKAGFFRLIDGQLQVQIAACQTETTDALTCDGSGAVLDIAPGDQLAVFEVDDTYLANCDWVKQACGPQTGLVTAGCPCSADSYQLRLGSAPGQVDVDLGTHTGADLFIEIK